MIGKVDVSEERGGSIFRVKQSKKNLLELPEPEKGDILFLRSTYQKTWRSILEEFRIEGGCSRKGCLREYVDVTWTK